MAPPRLVLVGLALFLFLLVHRAFRPKQADAAVTRPSQNAGVTSGRRPLPLSVDAASLMSTRTAHTRQAEVEELTSLLPPAAAAVMPPPAAAPATPASLPSCSVLFFHHLEKTGGTTLRSVLQRHAQFGEYDFISFVNRFDKLQLQVRWRLTRCTCCSHVLPWTAVPAAPSADSAAPAAHAPRRA